MLRYTALLVLLLSGCGASTQQVETVTVVQLSYVAGTTSTGVGPAIGGNGGIAVTTSSTSAQYNVIVDCLKHGRVIIDSKRLFSVAKPGDQVEVTYWEAWYGSGHEFVKQLN